MYEQLIKKLFILKLRFNPKEDFETLEILDYFIDFYKSEFLSEREVKEAYSKVELLIENIQNLLKNEWEKVKRESKGRK